MDPSPRGFAFDHHSGKGEGALNKNGPGEEALSREDLLYLEFLEKFENQFLRQPQTENRDGRGATCVSAHSPC